VTKMKAGHVRFVEDEHMAQSIKYINYAISGLLGLLYPGWCWVLLLIPEVFMLWTRFTQTTLRWKRAIKKSLIIDGLIHYSISVGSIELAKLK
jgi:hypothetical protein